MDSWVSFEKISCFLKAPQNCWLVPGGAAKHVDGRSCVTDYPLKISLKHAKRFTILPPVTVNALIKPFFYSKQPSSVFKSLHLLFAMKGTNDFQELLFCTALNVLQLKTSAFELYGPLIIAVWKIPLDPVEYEQAGDNAPVETRSRWNTTNMRTIPAKNPLLASYETHVAWQTGSASFTN